MNNKKSFVIKTVCTKYGDKLRKVIETDRTYRPTAVSYNNENAKGNVKIQ